MTTKWKGFTLAAVMATATTLALPAQAAAVDAKVYEVTENMVLDDLAAPTLRTATAALQGTAKVGTPLCPQALIQLLIGLGLVSGPGSCMVTAIGEDEIVLATGAGTLTGAFAVVVNADNPVDAGELVVMTGTFAGGMQLLSGPTGPLPLIVITGATLTPTDVLGVPIPFVGALGLDPATFAPSSFGGVFRLPFALDKSGKKGKPRRGRDAFYLGDNGKPFPVKKDELSLGLPTVRVEITFAP